MPLISIGNQAQTAVTASRMTETVSGEQKKVMNHEYEIVDLHHQISDDRVCEQNIPNNESATDLQHNPADETQLTQRYYEIGETFV